MCPYRGQAQLALEQPNLPDWRLTTVCRTPALSGSLPRIGGYLHRDMNRSNSLALYARLFFFNVSLKINYNLA